MYAGGPSTFRTVGTDLFSPRLSMGFSSDVSLIALQASSLRQLTPLHSRLAQLVGLRVCLGS